MPDRKPYGSTAVPAERSMGAILAMLRARRITSRWSEIPTGTGDKVILQMLWSQGEAVIRARIETRIVPPDPPTPRRAKLRTSRIIRTAKQEEKAVVGERKRVLRVLHWWLKSQFEAVDAGLLSVVDVMLPFLEVGAAEGSPTVADLLRGRVAEMGMGPGSLVRALAAGAK